MNYHKPYWLSRSEIDEDLWNLTIDNSKQCVVYAKTWYLDAVCSDWRALVWPSRYEYRVIMPVPIRIKWGKRAVQQPLFCQYLGIFSGYEMEDALLRAFLKSLSEEVTYISKYCFNPHNSLQISRLNSQEFVYTEKRTHVLYLPSSYENLKAGFTNDRKLNLARAGFLKWKHETGDNATDLIRLFKENHAYNILGGVSDKAYRILMNLLASANTHAEVVLDYAVLDGEIHAGICLIKANNRVIYIFNAADNWGRKGNARTWLLNRFFVEYVGCDLLFDFESPEIASIASFYKSFGATPEIFLEIHQNQLPFPLNLMQQWRRRKAIGNQSAS